MRESGFSSWLNGRRFIRAVIAGVTALSFVLPPLAPAMAQSLTADPSGSTSIKAAPNGVPVVDIAGANGAGVSRNLYTDFNVGEKGLIFNNATGVTPSQLAGLLQANDKLGGRSASLILNEVTGANPSTLLGYMEIIGGRADLVVANPNGITCRGCGFINTPRATLSTGRAKLDPATGAFLGLDVEGGTVTIEQTNKGDGNDFGVDARQVDYFDIVAGLIMLDGAVYGKDVGLFGGAQDFDYASRTATAKAGSNLDDIVIDSSLLGGAYANRITLVGSGGGVKTPHEMKAAFGGISLTADGKIVFGKAAAEGAIKATSKSGSIEVAQDISVWSETALELTANKGTITLFDGATAGAKGDVTLKASSLDVRRDALLASGLDEFGQMSLAGLLTIEVAALANAGTIGAKEDVTITISGYGSNNGQIIAGGTLALMGGGTFSNEARGTLSGDTQVSINLGRFFNAGVLTSANGEMLIATAGNISNSGDIQSAGKLTMSLLGDLTNSGKLTSQTELGVTARNIRNTGELYSSGILSVLARSLLTNERRGVISGDGGVHLAAARFVNKGLAGSAKANLSADIAGSIQNYGLLYGRQDILLRLDGTLLNDKADIIAQNNLTVAGLTKRRANALTNVSGWIEATSGDLTIRADNVVNKRPRIVVRKTTSSSSNGSYTKYKTRKLNTYTSTNTTITTTIERFDSQASGTMGTLAAGRDLIIDAVSITNEASLIAANRDVILTGASLVNQGRNLYTTIEIETSTHTEQKKKNSGKIYKSNRFQRKEYNYIIGAASGTIQAGRNFRGSFTGQINNKSIRQNAGPTSALGGGSLSDLSKLDGNASIAASASALAERALFIESGDPNSHYVIETRAKFLDPDQYISTDVLLTGLSIQPEKTKKRLGDAYVETRLILEQLFATAGLRLLPGFNSVAEMMEALLQNALYLQKELGLTVGQALTQAQINALNKDIVWLVPQKFRGQTVWAPKLYLSDKTLKKIDRIGAQIVAGSDLDLEAPEISNSGALKAGQDIKIAGTDFKTRAGLVRGGRDLNINVADNFKNVSSTIEGRNVNIAAKNITNERETPSAEVKTIQKAQIKAAESLKLTAVQDVTNRGGNIEGGNVEIRANNIVNKRRVTRQQISGGYKDTLGAQSTIKARENLALVAKRDINNKAGTLEAGKDATLIAGRDINITAQQTEYSKATYHDRGYSKSYELKNHGSEIKAGGDVKAAASNNALFAGSNVTSGGDILLQAGGDVTIAAVQDKSRSESLDKKKGGLFSSSKRYQNQSYDETNVASVFEAEGAVRAASEKDFKVDGSFIGAGKDITLQSATKDVVVTAKAERHESFSSKKKSGFLSKSSKTVNKKQTVNQSAFVSGGGDVNIVSKARDVTIKGSGVLSGGDSNFLAARDVNLEAVQDTFSREEKSEKRGFFASSSSGGGGASVSVGYRKEKHEIKDKVVTNLVSEIRAGGSVNISAGRDVNSEAAIVGANNNIAFEAGRDINQKAVHDVQTHEEKHKTSQIGVTLSAQEHVTPALETIKSAPDNWNAGEGGATYSAITRASTGLRTADAIAGLIYGPLVSAGISVGVSSSKSSANSTFQEARVGLLQAGNDVTLKSGNNILLEGTQLVAGNNISADAGNDLNIRSAKSTYTQSSKSSQKSASVGVSVGLGISGITASGNVGASLQKSKANASATNHTLATLRAGNKLTLKSGRDTNIIGAAGSAKELEIDTARNLHIESVQNKIQSQHKSYGGSLSLSTTLAQANSFNNVQGGRGSGIPGFFGKQWNNNFAGDVLNLPNQVGGSFANGFKDNGKTAGIGFNFAKGYQDRAWVDQPSVFSGTGKVTINVGGNTHLKGASVFSKNGDLTLNSGTLTHENITDYDRSKNIGFSINLSHSFGGPGGQTDTQKTKDATARVGDVFKASGFGVDGFYDETDKQGITRATIGAGDITIRDKEKQAELESSGKTQKVANINRELYKAQEITKDERKAFGVYATDTSVKHAIEAGKVAAEAIQEIGEAIGKTAEDILKATGEAFSAEDKKQLETALKDRFSGELSDAELKACLQSRQCTYETEHGSKELSAEVAGWLQRGEGNFLNDLNALTGDGYSNRRQNAAGAKGRPVGAQGRAVIDRNVEIFWKSYLYADSIGDEALKRDLAYEIGRILGGQNYLYSDAGLSDASRIYAALPTQYKNDLLTGFAGGFEQTYGDKAAAIFSSLTVLLNRKAPGVGTAIRNGVSNKAIGGKPQKIRSEPKERKLLAGPTQNVISKKESNWKVGDFSGRDPIRDSKGKIIDYGPVDVADSPYKVIDRRLPKRITGRPTRGILDLSEKGGKNIEYGLKSGPGPGTEAFPPGAGLGPSRSHVEASGAAILNKSSATHATLKINNPGGPCGTCKGGIPKVLKPGKTLDVKWLDEVGDERIIRFTNEGWKKIK